MQSARTWFLFLLLLACAALFIVFTGQALPPFVASHFSGSGLANGSMARGTYLIFMCSVASGVPLVIAGLQALLIRRAPEIKIPNRDYWLAPQRKDMTLAFLDAHSRRFAVLLAVFLCLVHWLVVQANQVQPPHLDSTIFIACLVGFLLATAVWLGSFYLHFRAPG